MHKAMFNNARRVMQGKVTKNEFYIYAYVLLTTAYVVLSLALPPNAVTLNKYDITKSQLRLISLTVIVPIVVIWFTALYGFMRFKSYAEVIRGSKEGKAFNHLADGLMILAFGLPVSGIIGAVLGYISRESADLAPTATIWRNYLSLVFFIVAFMLVAKGARGLVKTLRATRTDEYPKYSAAVLIVLSSIFTALIIARPAGDNAGTIYYLPDWLIVTTLAIPYLFVWHKGMLAAYHLYIYKNKLRGQIYKQAFGNLAMGIAGIVGVSIVIQFLVTITEQLNRLNLAPLLIVLYLLIALYAVGYGLVARGAKKLKKIEEV